MVTKGLHLIKIETARLEDYVFQTNSFRLLMRVLSDKTMQKQFRLRIILRWVAATFRLQLAALLVLHV